MGFFSSLGKIAKIAAIGAIPGADIAFQGIKLARQSATSAPRVYRGTDMATYNSRSAFTRPAMLPLVGPAIAAGRALASRAMTAPIAAGVAGGGAASIVGELLSDGTLLPPRRHGRRRRRALFTNREISDIAALKAVVGGGKVFESVLITRLSRSR